MLRRNGAGQESVQSVLMEEVLMVGRISEKGRFLSLEWNGELWMMKSSESTKERGGRRTKKSQK